MKGWRKDSGLFTDKFSLPVKQLRFGDVDEPDKEGFYILGKLKCYGIVPGTIAGILWFPNTIYLVNFSLC